MGFLENPERQNLVFKPNFVPNLGQLILKCFVLSEMYYALV